MRDHDLHHAFGGNDDRSLCDITYSERLVQLVIAVQHPDFEQSGGGTSTVSVPPEATSTSATLQSCLSRYSDTANAYPCSDCVPLLSSTMNDFLQPLVNGNATNVGAALQYCAMMDLAREMNTTGVTGWGQDRSVCGWTGVQCDPRGRVGNL